MTSRAPEPHVSRGGRSVPMLVAAAILVVGVVVAVLVFGVQSPPAVEPLDEAAGRTPDAALAWLSHDGEESCLRIAWPDGGDDRPWCDDTAGEVSGWEEGSVLVSDYSGGSPRRLLVDPRTGDVLEVRLDDEPGPIHHDGSVVTFREAGEQVFVLDDRELWRVEAPEGYELRTSSVSPDGAWVAMVDEADRLLVAPADGSSPPRLWTDEVSTWGPLVWQGS